MNQSPDLIHAALAIAAALLYVSAASRQLLQLDRSARDARGRGVIYLSFAAVAAHLLLAIIDFQGGSLNLGFYKVASLIFLAMSVISLVTVLIRPMHMLICALFPLAALAVLVNAFAPATGQPLDGASAGVILHIVLALVAFAVLTLAALQGALVSQQTQRLRSHQTRGIVRMLPPLDSMERMFYELLTVGTAALTLAIIAGAVFIEDLLGQKLVHKTVLTLVSWAVFSGTLLMHWLRGLRIGTALALVFSAFATLMLGFFGSKLVLELLV